MRNRHTILIREKAKALGFTNIGIAKAAYMDDEARRLEQWLTDHRHGKMAYMERHFDLRVDPRKLVPSARSVISMTYPYHNPAKPPEGTYRIAQYAYGEDYHHVIKAKMRTIFTWMQDAIGAVEGRYFVDSAPVLERDWAKRSGVGWIGKNTLLLNRGSGSYFFLAEMILDIDLVYDLPIGDYCGTCTRCIDACPTDAIDAGGYSLDSNKCISYLTIELKEAIPDEFQSKVEPWIFGCDICQEVCPWNRFATPHKDDKFNPHPELLQMTNAEWETISHAQFNSLFRHSAVKRTKFAGLQRNINFIIKVDHE